MRRAFVLLAAAAIGLLTLAPSASDAASVETSCIGYARTVADQLRPAAPKGSPEYRAVYFPTLEECRRRGGSAAMPGGLAAAPWYLPKPAAPSANPYHPAPPAPPPAAGPAKPPAPPAAPYNPTPQTPPAATGTTAQQIVAHGRSRIEQTLPGGMSFPAAVKAAMDGCGVYAIQQADAGAGADDVRWAQIASASIETCIARGGAINGAFVLSRHLELALRMAKYKSAPFGKNNIQGSHACLPVEGESAYQNCVNDRGQWYICYQGYCVPVDGAVFVVGSGGEQPSEGMTAFRSCPGGSCLRRPNTVGPRVQPDPTGKPAIEGRRATIERMREECGKLGSKAQIHSCAVKICIQNAPPGLNNVQLAQHCTETVLEATGTHMVDYLQEVLAVDGPLLQVLAKWLSLHLTLDWERIVQGWRNAPVWSDPLFRPDVPTSVGVIRNTVMGLWFGFTEFVWELRTAHCRAQPQLCDSTTWTAIVGKDGTLKGQAAQYFTVAQWCRQRVSDLLQNGSTLGLTPGEAAELSESIVQSCIQRAPEDEVVRAMFAGIASFCGNAAARSGSDIRQWSGSFAACLARSPSLVPSNYALPLRARMAEAVGAIDFVLRNCSVGAGARWRDGAAEPIPGRVPPGPEFPRIVQSCLLDEISSIRLHR